MPFIKFDYFVIDQNIILANIIFANKTFEKALLISPACACSLKHVSMHNGALVQKHVIKDKACFQKHLREFEKSNKVFDVIYTEATTGELTAKQHDILRKAFELGYYDFPRKADLHKLANLLGVAPASALQNLRAATKKVIQKYLD
jgi:predicted DNA binding protein